MQVQNSATQPLNTQYKQIIR